MKIPFIPKSLKNGKARAIAPITSQISVVNITNLIIVLIFVLLSRPKDSRIRSLFLNDKLPFVTVIMLTSKRAYPRPPIWNRDINTICPKVVSVTETSIGDSPVTQTAEVATNNASKNLIFSFDEIGSNSNIVPITINKYELNFKIWLF